ncbi:MAG TPA: CRISPR-associated endonuclease Cas2 [Candidatus Paceibacterota bacterium]
MKGDITMKVLEQLYDSVIDVADFFQMFLTVGYGASYRKMQGRLEQIKNNRAQPSTEQYTKQNYYNFLYKLKRAGFIQEKPKGQNKVLAITKKGLEYLLVLQNQAKKRLPTTSYPKKPNKTFIIVAFDIPETERKKRNWLRTVLKNLELKMVQKSLWLGKTKIPEELLKDLHRLKLINFVEIFEITKVGSLKQLA